MYAKKSDNTSSSTSFVLKRKREEDRKTNLAEGKGAGEPVVNDIMISGKTAVAEKKTIAQGSIQHNSFAMPIIRKKSATSQNASSLPIEYNGSEPVLSSSPPSLSTKTDNTISEIGIALKAETTPIVSSTSEQLQRAPALVWRKNDAHTTPAGTSLGQPVYPVQKTVSVAMNSIDTNMLSRSQQAASSHEFDIETSSVDTIENPLSEPSTGAGTTGIDLSRMADRVSRILYRKLIVERERRGV